MLVGFFFFFIWWDLYFPKRIIFSSVILGAISQTQKRKWEWRQKKKKTPEQIVTARRSLNALIFNPVRPTQTFSPTARPLGERKTVFGFCLNVKIYEIYGFCLAVWIYFANRAIIIIYLHLIRVRLEKPRKNPSPKEFGEETDEKYRHLCTLEPTSACQAIDLIAEPKMQ